METISFYTNLEVFNIPLSTIKEGTYLDSYIRFSGKKDIREIIVEGEVIFVHHLDINNENPAEFKSFLVFLLGGEFEWNEEVSKFFELMGYINKHNYPLDYWKIKLQDNWIRDNFYSLELWNEKSQLSPLLIERGPYVGLIDYTNEFSGGNFITTYNPISILKQEIYQSEKYDDYVIAGGYLISILCDYPRKSKDIDFFITTKDQEKANKISKENILDYYGGDLVISNNSITIKGVSKSPAKQIILRLYTCPSEVVHGFDLDASGILFDGLKIYVTKRCHYSLTTKTNFFDFDRMSESYFYRLAKYASRGFKTWLPGLEGYSTITRRLNVQEWRHNYPRDELLNKTYLEVVNEGFKPFGIIEFKDDIDINFVNIFDKSSNPIDWIIFATHFKYIPNINISDYEVMKERKHKNVAIMFSEDLDGIYKIGGPFGGDDPSRYINVGPGYISIPKEVVNAINIYNLDNELVDISGLPKKIMWKTQNPMEQLSGTFNPTKLSDLDKLFATSKLLTKKS